MGLREAEADWRLRACARTVAGRGQRWLCLVTVASPTLFPRGCEDRVRSGGCGVPSRWEGSGQLGVGLVTMAPPSRTWIWGVTLTEAAGGQNPPFPWPLLSFINLFIHYLCTECLLP